ncbi:MAG: hypothetical protein IT332_15330 [Ardenticatenales bacterium]|nr:hypothetical protein [Ardenticatenales bacterium]
MHSARPTLLPASSPRPIRLHPTLAALVALAFAVIAGAPPGAPTVVAAPSDVPVPFAADNVEHWAVGVGLVYWAHNCFADEFNPFAALKRQPVTGGQQRTLQDINDGARCNTFHGLLSADDGLYYYDASQQHIARMPLGEPFTPVPVRALTAGQEPYAGRALVAAGGFLYWAHAGNKIFRAPMDGTGAIETVADTTALPTDLMVVGNYVYWTDATGVWTINVTCGALPCNGDRQQFAPFGANTQGHGLLYQSLGGVRGNYRVYWVERVASGANNTYTIRFRSCNQLTICTLDDPLTFYGATVNWSIGQLVAAAGNVYWTELDNTTVNNPNGDVKRRAYNAAAGTGADTIATAQAKVDGRIFVAGDALYFARRGVGIYTLSLNAAPIVRDLKADGLEVTQGIQDLGNAVPLVAGKATYVRAYGLQLSGPSTPNVEAQLVGSKGGAPLPGSPLQPMNGVRALATGGGYDRARLSDGWVFLLPANWITPGAVTLTFEVDGRRIHSDPDRANNEAVASVVFLDRPPVCVMTVPVRTNTALPRTTDPNFRTMVDHFHRRWPIPDVWVYRDTSPVEELEVCWYGPVPYPCLGPYELDDGWGLTNGIPDRDKVIVSLWTRALLSFNPDACDTIGAPVHFMGMVHPDAPNGGSSGYASTVSNQSWVQLPAHAPLGPNWDALREGSTMAQELAHNYGRKHINCGNPEDVDNDYKYPPCQIGNVGPASHYGFDTRTQRPIRPNETADFMTYADRSWVSDYTWRALISELGSVFAAALSPLTTLSPLPPLSPQSHLTLQSPQADPATTTQAPDAESVFVTGVVDTANVRGKITTLLMLPTGSMPLATRLSIGRHATGGGVIGTGGRNGAIGANGVGSASQVPAFRLRFLDTGGTVLVDRPLTPNPLDDHSPDGAAALFADQFARPVALVAAVQLWSGTTLLDTIVPSGAAPIVSLTKPAAGVVMSSSMTIEWSALDPDADDRLRFVVQYSPDGGVRWKTLAVDVPPLRGAAGVGGDVQGRLTLADLGTLPGSAAPNGSMIRVLASDGFNTGVATSPGFTVPNRPPEVVVSSPEAGETLAAGVDVVLIGSGLDAEDGGLSDDALSWRVDGRSVGAGRTIAVAGLAPGARVATLSGDDASGHTAAADVAFSIAPLAVPLGAPVGARPVLDGLCDDAVYAGGASLQLAPYADGSRGAVRVLRSGDHLWACFHGLVRGAADVGSQVEVLVDANHSRDALAQATDFLFAAAEDGSVLSRVGDGSGGFAPPGPRGVAAQLGASAVGWSVEMRLDKARFGGWEHLAGLAFGHTVAAPVGGPGGAHRWPQTAERGKPSTWATTSLGDLPAVHWLTPSSATVGGAPFALGVAGTGFISGTLVLWNGAPLATTFGGTDHLTATVTAAQLASAGIVQVTVRVPAPGAMVSNSLPFVVHGRLPVITRLAPTSVAAGGGAFTLVVHGTDFASDAQVLWDGAPLATLRLSGTELSVPVQASLIVDGRTVGIAVRNPSPVARVSNTVRLEVVAPTAVAPSATAVASATATASQTATAVATGTGTAVATGTAEATATAGATATATAGATAGATATPPPTATARATEGPGGDGGKAYLPWANRQR